ncbi:MAG: flavodoxin family protein [Clostridia bacterium]|nr:flavodoxin family protein [Clostridia bacterium]
MKPSLIVYYSLTGNVADTVQKIAKEIDADTLELFPKAAYPDEGVRKFLWGGKSAVMGEEPTLEPYEFDGEKYDRIIFASPVWAGTFAPPLRTFIRANREALAGRIYAAVLCHGGAGADLALKKLRQELGLGQWQASVVLVDPKDRPSEENEQRLKAFYKELEFMAY